VGVVPPLIGVAVKVTLVPAQIVPDGTAAMFTLAGKLGFTVIVIVFDVACELVTHVALEVIIQFIVFPFARVALV